MEQKGEISMENNLEFKVARLHKLDIEGSLKAYVDILLNQAILFKGIRIVEGKRGLFVSMPREKGKDGKWYEIVRPMSREVKERISMAVLSVYNDAP